MKKVYLINDGSSALDYFWFSDNIEEVPVKTTSLKEVPWLLSDIEENSGNFYLIDLTYDSEATFEVERVIYVVQAPDIQEAIRIIKKEVGPSFNSIQSIDKLDFKEYKE